MKNAIESTTLWSTKNGSDKTYSAAIVPNPSGGYDVVAQNGPRGGTQTVQKPKAVGVDLDAAQAAYAKVVKEKIKSGYNPMDGSSIAIAAVSERDGKSANVPVMLLDAIGASELAQKFGTAQYMWQQKHDGHRRLIVTSGSEAHGVNRKGEYVPLSPAIAEAALSMFGPDATVDGELVGETFFAFDLLKIGGIEFTDKRADARHSALCKYMEIGSKICASPDAIRFVENVDSVDELRLAGAEGIVGKLRSAQYCDGKKHGVALKYKFWNTATVEVIRHNQAHSIGVAVYESTGGQVDVGNVTLPPSMRPPAIGAFVEVRYLYAYRNGSLYQPAFQMVRTDMTRTDCAIEQLVYKGEEIAA